MKKHLRVLLFGLTFIIAACAVITVNIYFPEKDVKEAYKVLEKELMGTDKKIDENKPAGKPESSIQFEFVRSAYAQEPGLADKIAEAVRKMPDVVNAYKEMGARIADTDRLRDSGGVGEGNNGLLMEREKGLSPADKKIIDAENENRKTVINGMARAIIRINRQPETSDNLKQVIPQATAQFASIRRDSAKKGWWIQDSSGNWGKR
ncbi:MAG: DUF1318 domain-containing protein [Nitrospirae bacterium]|nr:DUF1318 domain-containing protein [Nitrospirota bacterium]